MVADMSPSLPTEEPPARTRLILDVGELASADSAFLPLVPFAAEQTALLLLLLLPLAS